jgi:hypothetical protein
VYKRGLIVKSSASFSVFALVTHLQSNKEYRRCQFAVSMQQFAARIYFAVNALMQSSIMDEIF